MFNATYDLGTNRVLREMLSGTTDALLLFIVRTPGSIDMPLDDLEMLMPPFLTCHINYQN